MVSALNTKYKFLFFAPLPPPITGQALAVDLLHKHISKCAEVTLINTSKGDLQNSYRFIFRLKGVVLTIWKIYRTAKSHDLIYYNISQSIFGNIKDMIVFSLCYSHLSRMVLHLHGGNGMKEIMSAKHLWLRAINTFFLRRVSAVIVLGKRLESIYDGVVPPSRLYTVPNFAKDEFFVSSSDIDNKFANVQPLRLLFLSNFLPGKGHEELLKAIAQLPTDIKLQIHVDFAGQFDSPENEALFRKQVQAIANVQINLHGLVSGELKRDLLSKAHLLCLPTYYSNEGQPLAILEAYASGCAVLTTDHSGIFDVFTPGHNGFVVQSKSTEAIVKVIVKAVSEPKKLCKFAHNNLLDAHEKYRTSRHLSAIEKILFVLAGQKRKLITHRNSIESGYKICVNCIMDKSDSLIDFDDSGSCDYCNNFSSFIRPGWDADLASQNKLKVLAERIRRDGKDREFDCIIGLSGGLDSSYVAYLAKEKMGLRPLLFHVDAGWNTDQAVGNIEKLVDGLGLDLYTDVVNWEAIKRMQVAFFRAGVPDQDLVQDAAFFSGLYKFARKYKVKHIITGSNFSTECCREPEEWGGYLGIDKTLFGDIWAKCGDGQPNDDFPLVDILVYKLWYQKVLGIKVHHPLNLVPFVKKDAEDELERRFGWQRFQHKHHESRFTRFYEDYWLPRRFGFEKRRAHFSSLIMTDQMTRDQALVRISRPEMDEHFLKQEFEYVAHKLGLTVEELQALFDMPKKTFRDYKNKRDLIYLGANLMRKLNLEKRYFR